MTTTVPAGPDTTRISRRAVLAAIALADAPTPNEITFRQGDTRLHIDLDHLADLRPWAKVFGVDTKAVTAALSKSNLSRWKKTGGQQMVSAWLHVEWQGWKVSIDADEPASGNVDPLDDATRKQLRAVANEPATTCPYTQSHTRAFCGYETCRES